MDLDPSRLRLPRKRSKSQHQAAFQWTRPTDIYQTVSAAYQTHYHRVTRRVVVISTRVQLPCHTTQIPHRPHLRQACSTVGANIWRWMFASRMHTFTMTEIVRFVKFRILHGRRCVRFVNWIVEFCTHFYAISSCVIFALNLSTFNCPTELFKST